MFVLHKEKVRRINEVKLLRSHKILTYVVHVYEVYINTKDKWDWDLTDIKKIKPKSLLQYILRRPQVELYR